MPPPQQQPPATAVSGHSDSNSGRMQPNNSFVCTFCGEAFTVLFDWTRHVRKHASSIITLNLQARNGSAPRPTLANGAPANTHSTGPQQHSRPLATATSSTSSPDTKVTSINTAIKGDDSGPGDRSTARRQSCSTVSNMDSEVDVPSFIKKEETKHDQHESTTTTSCPRTGTFPVTTNPMDAQTPPSHGSSTSALVAAKLASLLNLAQKQTTASPEAIPPSKEPKTTSSTSPQAVTPHSASSLVKESPASTEPDPSLPPPPPPPPTTLVPPSPGPPTAEHTKPTTTNSHQSQSAVLTTATQSRASVSMPLASSKITPVATRNQSKSDSKPTQSKVDAVPAASSVSFPMPSPAVPSPASSSSPSSSSSSSSTQRKTKRYRTQSDIDDEADFAITGEPFSQPQEDKSRLRCLWRQNQSLNGQQQRQQQREVSGMSRSKGKSRALETSNIAETCRISFESDIELIGHYVQHISLMETRFECPVKLCKTILPTEAHLQMHLERFHPEMKSKATPKAGARKKPPSTDSPDTPKRGSSRSSTPASTSGRTAPQALQQTKQRRTRMQTKGSKTAQAAPPPPPAVAATKRVFRESPPAVSATKRVFRESSPIVSPSKRVFKESSPAVSSPKRVLTGSPPPMSATKKSFKASSTANLSTSRDISESIANIDKALSLGEFLLPVRKSSGKMTTSRTRG